jgi:hypothetical protein
VSLFCQTERAILKSFLRKKVVPEVVPEVVPAERKTDEAILIHIRGKDCVAIEVKYHNR